MWVNTTNEIKIERNKNIGGGRKTSKGRVGGKNKLENTERSRSSGSSE